METAQEIEEAVRAVLNEKEAKRKHHSWRKRLVVISTTLVILMYVGDVLHYECFVRGWEFITPVILDKFIFGIGE